MVCFKIDVRRLQRQRLTDSQYAAIENDSSARLRMPLDLRRERASAKASTSS